MESPLVLFVCTGNTCRSPLAEALLLHALRGDPRFQQGDDLALRVASAGLAASPGSPMASHSQALLKEIGIALPGHGARRVEAALTDPVLLIVAMAEHHREHLRRQFPQFKDRLVLLSEFIPGLSGEDIPDPVGGPREEYVEVLDLIVAALPALLTDLAQRLEFHRSQVAHAKTSPPPRAD